MEDLLKLQDMLDSFLSIVKDDLDVGGERVQPYICILEGVLKGIGIDLNSD